MATASAAKNTTIRPSEVEGFAAIAHEWWDEKGKFAPLHRLNPVRIGYIRDQAVGHFKLDGESATPLANLSLLDVGCGGGILAEPMARLGATVTGIDAAKEAVEVATNHAKVSGLTIDYRVSTAEELANFLPLEGEGQVGVTPSPNPSPPPTPPLKGGELRSSISCWRWKLSSMSPIPRCFTKRLAVW